MVPLGCPVRPGNKALQVEFGAGNPSLITGKKKNDWNHTIRFGTVGKI